ncbi:methyltransferase domain-containing protein [Iamia majanohamensis]|uniref:Methyltransferase domain-containing protein n=1 Tax=Iamia majanohamensis TaxID=467976 RepID=A0AAE9YGA1_9ACTN|nr:class I SAM-dependent methyltransferase [Iamia majanohamensis]WCO67256.1 methyltransferase domain-containing protein [Iamia majanohamensis]
MTADEPGANDYDAFAEAYAAETEDNLVNAHYERPAVLDLAGDVAGRRILDAGCGTGPLTAALRDRGATVTGIDASAEMLALARQRLGAEVDLRVVDLRDPLPFADSAFDDVVASLVLHYLEDWAPTLAELHRVLAHGGRLIASVEHPFQSQAQASPGADYFAVRPWSFVWDLGGHRAHMRFWHRPLAAMTDVFTSAGFRITAIREPQPTAEARRRFPDQVEALATSPCFLFFELEAGDAPTEADST